ncbi:DUF418 domain-containing protein [Spongiactinospora sp. 9N601]|uniref:DUF418 domain-containing protein n=1 Tax=Spongiactinospora sp. 9N601 TaxID=3375149 RepID=UPI0037B6EA89
MAHSASPPLPGPTAPRERMLAPDLARGLMLALIALANSAIYLYGRDYGVRQHIVEHDLVDRVTGTLVLTLVDFRAYPMFAALFGYGMARMLARRRALGGAAGEEAGRRLLRRRSAWLIAFGAVHATLLFPADILGLYGLIGLVAYRLLQRRDRTLLVLAAAWLPLVAVTGGLLYGSTGHSSERVYFWSFALPDPVDALLLRPLEWLMLPFGMFGVLSAVLVGMWAGRRDLFTRPDARRVLRPAAAIGIPLSIAGGLPVGLVGGGFATVGAPLAAMAINGLHVVTGIAGGLGYAALIGLVALRIGERRGLPVRALSACGERSLTCYLAQSVVFVALLAPYTLGLGGRLGSAATAGLALATWAVTVVLAYGMERAGVRGPAEALLRKLTYRARG